MMQAATARPIIKSRFGNIVRPGRGYSMEELQEAGLGARVARKSGVPVDVWRKTKYPENVEQLKSLAKAIRDSRKGSKQTEEKTGEGKARKKAGSKKTRKEK